jgi:hypothetical protein
MSSVDVLYDIYLIFYEIECKTKRNTTLSEQFKNKISKSIPYKKKSRVSVKLFDFVRIILSLNVVSIVLLLIDILCRSPRKSNNRQHNDQNKKNRQTNNNVQKQYTEHLRLSNSTRVKTGVKIDPRSS